MLHRKQLPLWSVCCFHKCEMTLPTLMASAKFKQTYRNEPRIKNKDNSPIS